MLTWDSFWNIHPVTKSKSFMHLKMSLNGSLKSSIVLSNLVLQLRCKLYHYALASLRCKYQLPRVWEQQDQAALQGRSRVAGEMGWKVGEHLLTAMMVDGVSHSQWWPDICSDEWGSGASQERWQLGTRLGTGIPETSLRQGLKWGPELGAVFLGFLCLCHNKCSSY